MANFQDQHPADVAEHLTNELESKERNMAFLMLPPEKKTLVFRFLQPQVQIEIIKSLGSKEQADMLRSEEHTSELQSRGHLVCRLLLEKKKTRTTNSTSTR